MTAGCPVQSPRSDALSLESRAPSAEYQARSITREIARLRGEVLSERGGTMVEFALIVIPFLLFVMVIVDGGRLFFTWVDLTHYTREAARYGVVYAQESSGAAGCAAGDSVCWQTNLESLVGTYAVTENGGASTSCTYSAATTTTTCTDGNTTVLVFVSMDNSTAGQTPSAYSEPTLIEATTKYTVTFLNPVLEQVSPTVPLTVYAQMRAE